MLILASLASAACSPLPPRYVPETHRELMRELLPEVAPGELVTPFEIDDALAAQAIRATRFAVSDRQRTLFLVDALSRPTTGFGLSYIWARNNSALATARGGGGTCMGLSSLLIGLLRSLDIEAYYAEARVRPEVRDEGVVQVAAGHIAVVALTDAGPIYVDFTGRIAQSSFYRRLSDREATAHYYNNYGYEILHAAERAGTPIDWARVRRQFELATRVAPELAMAWNNDGVASVRLGELDRAEVSYLRALDIAPAMRSPRENLARLRELWLAGDRDAAAAASRLGELLVEPPREPRPGGEGAAEPDTATPLATTATEVDSEDD